MAVIRTVLGDIPAEELGVTLCHEHLLIDLKGVFREPDAASERHFAHAPVSMENLGWVRMNYCCNWDNLGLYDEEMVAEELRHYRRAGGAAVVEVTPSDVGRDPVGLVRLSRNTGIHIVMGSGFYVDACQSPETKARSEADIAEELIHDMIAGAGATGIRAGIIGEIGCSWPLAPSERKVLRAAARAQRATGAAITIHPGRNASSPREVVDVIEDAGGDAGRVIMGHLDRTLFDLDGLTELAATGCYLEFDMFGMESTYYPMAPVDMPNDGRRIDLILGLMDAGFADKILVSHDIAFKHLLVRYGGTGYAHILRYAVPRMQLKRMRQDQLDALLVLNPRRILALQQPDPR